MGKKRKEKRMNSRRQYRDRTKEVEGGEEGRKGKEGKRKKRRNVK